MQLFRFFFKVFDDDVIEIGQAAKLNIQINNSPLHSWNSGRITIDGFGILETFSIRSEKFLSLFS